MKKCKDCHRRKPDSEFYGVQTECKVCTRKRVGAYRAANIEKVRAYDRERGQTPERKAKNREDYRRRVSTPEGRAREWAYKRKHIDRNPAKRAAHLLVQYAIKRGDLNKKPCQRCGATKRIHAHHEDYTKPLEVTWLCRKCHGKRHREINEENRYAQ